MGMFCGSFFRLGPGTGHIRNEKGTVIRLMFGLLTGIRFLIAIRQVTENMISGSPTVSRAMAV